MIAFEDDDFDEDNIYHGIDVVEFEEENNSKEFGDIAYEKAFEGIKSSNKSYKDSFDRNKLNSSKLSSEELDEVMLDE